jgi:putative redox protein
MPFEPPLMPLLAFDLNQVLNSSKERTFKIKMASMHITSKGQKRFELCHPSGAKIETDAPIDNHGKGEAFSPTDLLAASLAACMLTILEIEMEKSGTPLAWAKADITKIMQGAPRRVAKVNIELCLPKAIESNPSWLNWKHAMENCPVARSVHPELLQIINYRFEEESPVRA